MAVPVNGGRYQTTPHFTSNGFSTGYGSSAVVPSVASAGRSMLSSVVPGVAGFVLGQISDAIGYHRQKKLMEQQNKYAVEQWERQNAYDSPTAQMRRLQAAGLNPDMIYGQMGNGQAAQMMATEQNVNSSSGARDFQSGIAASVAARQLALNEQSVESQIGVNEALAEKYRADAAAQGANVEYRQRLVKAQDIVDDLRRANIQLSLANASVAAARVNEIGQHIEEMISHGQLMDSQTMLNNIEAVHKEEWYKLEFAKLRSEIHLNEANAKRVQQIFDQEAEMFVHKMGILQHQENISWAEQVSAYAEAATKRWQYLLDEDGRPYASKGGATVQVLDLMTQFLGRIVGVQLNRFKNTSSYTTESTHGKVGRGGDMVLTGWSSTSRN